MNTVNINMIREGMTLLQDVCGANGRLLLKSGTTIDSKHIRILNMWGVTEICVAGDSAEDNTHDDARPFLPDAEQYVLARFAEKGLEEGPEQELRKLAVLAAEERLSSGFKAPSHGQDTLGSGEIGDAPAFEAILERDPSLASLPETYLAIRLALDDPGCTASRLADIISSDVAMSAKLLKLVNSSALGENRKIDSLSRGVIVLGAREVGQLALSLTVLTKFAGASSCHISMTDMLKHSVACGVFAGLLALRMNIREFERFFVAGILHDVGRLVLFQCAPEHAAKALFHANAAKLPLWKAERDILGYDHCLIARHLLSRWGIPESLVELVADHHDPDSESSGAAVINVADALAMACEYGGNGLCHFPGLDLQIWGRLALPVSILPVIAQQARRQLADTLNIFLEH